MFTASRPYLLPSSDLRLADSSARLLSRPPWHHAVALPGKIGDGSQPHPVTPLKMEYMMYIWICLNMFDLVSNACHALPWSVHCPPISALVPSPHPPGRRHQHPAQNVVHSHLALPLRAPRSLDPHPWPVAELASLESNFEVLLYGQKPLENAWAATWISVHYRSHRTLLTSHGLT